MPDAVAGAGGEFSLLRRLAARLDGAGGAVVVGPGDDAAVLVVPDGCDLLVAVDVVVDGVHVHRDLSSWADIGWKALAVNVSDLAAMGGDASAAVVGLVLPGDVDDGAVEELYDGLRAAADRWGVALVGGDTTSGATFSVAVTALGNVPRGGAVTRAGAREGDAVVVVGPLGGAAAALRAVARGEEPAASLLAAHRRPVALPRAGRVLARSGATAMIDVSDGLGADLGHVCAASRVGAVVDAGALPLASALPDDLVGEERWRVVCAGGEDFALVACVPADGAQAVARAAGAAEGVAAAVVGEIVARPHGDAASVRLRLPSGGSLDLDGWGYEHRR